MAPNGENMVLCDDPHSALSCVVGPAVNMEEKEKSFSQGSERPGHDWSTTPGDHSSTKRGRIRAGSIGRGGFYSAERAVPEPTRYDPFEVLGLGCLRTSK